MKTVVALAIATLYTSVAFAQKPIKEPFAGESQDYPPYPAGELCDFPVRVMVDGKQNAIYFPSGRQMIVGNGSVTVTNVDNGKSLSLSTTGRYSERLLTDGTWQLETNGRQLFFSYPQDVGGPALTFATGQARMIYDVASDTVTSLRLSGQTVDVCQALE